MHDASYVLEGRRSAGQVTLSAQSRVENIGHDLLLRGTFPDWQGRPQSAPTSLPVQILELTDCPRARYVNGQRFVSPAEMVSKTELGLLNCEKSTGGIRL